MVLHSDNSPWPSDAIWWVNFGSGSDMLLDGTKPFPDPLFDPYVLCGGICMGTQFHGY